MQNKTGERKTENIDHIDYSDQELDKQSQSFRLYLSHRSIRLAFDTFFSSNKAGFSLAH